MSLIIYFTTANTTFNTNTTTISFSNTITISFFLIATIITSTINKILVILVILVKGKRECKEHTDKWIKKQQQKTNKTIKIIKKNKQRLLNEKESLVKAAIFVSFSNYSTTKERVERHLLTVVKIAWNKSSPHA